MRHAAVTHRSRQSVSAPVAPTCTGRHASSTRSRPVTPRASPLHNHTWGATPPQIPAPRHRGAAALHATVRGHARSGGPARSAKTLARKAPVARNSPSSLARMAETLCRRRSPRQTHRGHGAPGWGAVVLPSAWAAAGAGPTEPAGIDPPPVAPDPPRASGVSGSHDGSRGNSAASTPCPSCEPLRSFPAGPRPAVGPRLPPFPPASRTLRAGERRSPKMAIPDPGVTVRPPDGVGAGSAQVSTRRLRRGSNRKHAWSDASNGRSTDRTLMRAYVTTSPPGYAAVAPMDGRSCSWSAGSCRIATSFDDCGGAG